MFDVFLNIGLQNLKTVYKRWLYFENWTVSGTVLKMSKWSAFITRCDWTFPHAVQRDYCEVLIFQNRNKKNEIQSQFLKNSTLNMLLLTTPRWLLCGSQNLASRKSSLFSSKMRSDPSTKGHFMSTASILFKIVQSSLCPDTLHKSMGNDTQDFAKCNAMDSSWSNESNYTKHYNLSINVGNELLTHTKRRLVLSWTQVSECDLSESKETGILNGILYEERLNHTTWKVWAIFFSQISRYINIETEEPVKVIEMKPNII